MQKSQEKGTETSIEFVVGTTKLFEDLQRLEPLNTVSVTKALLEWIAANDFP